MSQSNLPRPPPPLPPNALPASPLPPPEDLPLPPPPLPAFPSFPSQSSLPTIGRVPSNMELPPPLIIPSASPATQSSSRRRADMNELEALLMQHVEKGNLNPPTRTVPSLSVSAPADPYTPGQPSPVPLPPPLPLPKVPSGSPNTIRNKSPNRLPVQEDNERPPSPHHNNTISEIHFTALKRDIKKGGKALLQRLKNKESRPSPATSPAMPSPLNNSPQLQAKKEKDSKKDRQSVFLFASKTQNTSFSIPVRVVCVHADQADGTPSTTPIWEFDTQIGSKTKVAELWERLRESGKMEVAETHAICKDEEIMSEKEYLNKYKIKQGDVLLVKPRTKKVVKSALNHLIARRPSRDELVSRHIIATKAPEISVESIPDVETIQRCVDYLIETEAFKVEGLFRISAGAMNLKTFYETFRKHEPDFTICDTPHTVAAALKQYFRGLPAGLIPLRVAIPMREAFLKIGEKPELMPELAKLAKELPKPNLQVINSVFRLVLLVIKNQETSKMDDRNCSIVFAPNVFAFDTNMDLMEQSAIQTKLVHTFFLHYEEIFGEATANL